MGWYMSHLAILTPAETAIMLLVKTSRAHFMNRSTLSRTCGFLNWTQTFKIFKQVLVMLFYLPTYK